MEKFIKIIVVYENDHRLQVEGCKNTIYYDPETNELEFKNAGNGKIKLNTLFAKKIIIDDELVKGNELYFH